MYSKRKGKGIQEELEQQEAGWMLDSQRYELLNLFIA